MSCKTKTPYAGECDILLLRKRLYTKTSILDLNIKVIGNNIHTSVYNKREDFGFSIVNFPWLSGDVPRLPSYGIYISELA